MPGSARGKIQGTRGKAIKKKGRTTDGGEGDYDTAKREKWAKTVLSLGPGSGDLHCKEFRQEGREGGQMADVRRGLPLRRKKGRGKVSNS